MSDQEQIWQVDEDDNPIGPVGRGDSRKFGLKYRMVRVSVEDESGRILIQKRVATKKTYRNCWDTSAGGNVDYPESYDEAAHREVFEEIGVKDASLQEVAYFYAEGVDPDGNKMNRFTKLYKTIIDPAFDFQLQPTEVSEVRWVAKEELLDIARKEDITDGLQQAIHHYYGASL